MGFYEPDRPLEILGAYRHLSHQKPSRPEEPLSGVSGFHLVGVPK